MGDIQGIDGSVLLNALRAGRQDRFNDDTQRLKIATGQMALQKQQAVTGLLAQAAGGGSGGVMGNAMGSSAPLTGAPGVSGGMAGSSPGGGINPQLIGRIAVLDPETADKMATAFKSVSETQLKQLQAKNDAMGAAAHYVAQSRDPAERMAVFQHAIPILLQAGWSQAEIDGAQHDLSDQRLGMYQHLAGTYDKMIEDELKQREFMAGKTTPVAPGGGLAVTKPVIGSDGSVSTQTNFSVVPNTGGAPTGAPASPAPNAPPKLIQQRPTGKTDEQLIHDAHEAVKKGANVESVFRQLQAWGVNP